MEIGKRVIVVLALQLTTMGLAIAGPSPQQHVGDSLEHLEGRFTRAMDELNGKDSIGIYGDMVTLEKIADDARSPSEESDDPFVSRVERFLRTRKIQVNLPDDASTAGLFGRALGQRNIDIELRGLTQGASEGKRHGSGERDRCKIDEMIRNVRNASCSSGRTNIGGFVNSD